MTSRSTIKLFDVFATLAGLAGAAYGSSSSSSALRKKLRSLQYKALQEGNLYDHSEVSLDDKTVQGHCAGCGVRNTAYMLGYGGRVAVNLVWVSHSREAQQTLNSWQHSGCIGSTRHSTTQHDTSALGVAKSCGHPALTKQTT